MRGSRAVRFGGRRGHDRFEALAGALALGEASDEERAEFSAHAAGCAQCSDDLSLGSVRERIAQAASQEVWRPSLGAELREQICEARSNGRRRALTTFGYAIAASLALNVLFVTGFAGRALDAVRQAPEFYSQTQRITLERRPQLPAAASFRRTQPVAADLVRERGSARKHSARKPPAATKSADPVPDVLAGLSIWNADETARGFVAKAERDCGEPTAAKADPQRLRSCLANRGERRSGETLSGTLGDGRTP